MTVIIALPLETNLGKKSSIGRIQGITKEGRTQLTQTTMKYSNHLV